MNTRPHLMFKDFNDVSEFYHWVLLDIDEKFKALDNLSDNGPSMEEFNELKASVRSLKREVERLELRE